VTLSDVEETSRHGILEEEASVSVGGVGQLGVSMCV